MGGVLLTQRNRGVQRVAAPDLSRPRHLLGRRSGGQLHRRRHRALGRTPPLLLRCREVAPAVGRRAGDVGACTLVCRGRGAGRAHERHEQGQPGLQLQPTNGSLHACPRSACHVLRGAKAAAILCWLANPSPGAPAPRTGSRCPPAARPARPPESLRCHVMWRSGSGMPPRICSGRPSRSARSSGSGTLGSGDTVPRYLSTHASSSAGSKSPTTDTCAAGGWGGQGGQGSTGDGQGQEGG